MKRSYIFNTIAVIACTMALSAPTNINAQSKVVKVGTVTLPAKGDATNIYETIVNFTADATFTIEIDGVDYGFTTYSGNGGAGTIAAGTNSVRAAGSYVDKSIGQLSTDGSPLRIATGSGGKLLVRVYLSYSDNIPRYYTALVADAQDVILKESFDLFSWGGDWTMGNTLTYRGFSTTPSQVIPADKDGTEPTTTTVTVAITGTTSFNSADATLFTANRDLGNWSFTKICEMPGYIRLSSPEKGAITTPALTALTAPSNITVEFDVCRFAGAGNIDFKVEGAGTILSASYVDLIDPSLSYGGTYTRHTTPVAIPDVSGTAFQINTDMAPPWSGGLNNNIKYWTHFTVALSGATAETKITWDATAVTSVNDGRICFDNVLVTRTSSVNSLPETKADGTLVYPNPVKAGETLQLTSPGETNTIRIFDIYGRPLPLQSRGKATLTAPTTPGIYLLQWDTTGGTTRTQQIIVK